MQARVNPDRLAADATFSVRHPDTGRAFPSPGVFDLSDADFRNPRVRRLFARAGQTGGLDGGVFGDLLAVTATTATLSTATKEQ